MTKIPHRISAFDLDHTLLKENSSYCFGKYLYKEKHISLSAFLFVIRSNLSYMLGLLSVSEVHQRAFHRLFRGRLQPLVESWVSAFLDAHLNTLIYPPALKALLEAQQAGYITAILSSSPSFLVEPIAHRLGLTFYQASQYAVDSDNRFCHIGHLLLGEDKARFMIEYMYQHKIPKIDVTAYSDSFIDLPFLLAAGKAIGANPEKKLRNFCIENNWSTI